MLGVSRLLLSVVGNRRINVVAHNPYGIKITLREDITLHADFHLPKRNSSKLNKSLSVIASYRSGEHL